MKAILFVLALVTTSTFAAPIVDCQTSPGNLICRNLADIKSTMGYTCTGNACYRVWRNQIHAMNRFIQNYNAYVTYSPITTVEMGNLAHDAANKICGAKSTGACEWMKSLFHAKVDALERLVEIQKGANLTSVRNCSVSYHCP